LALKLLEMSFPRRTEIFPLILCILLLITVILHYVRLEPEPSRSTGNYGFDASWSCSPQLRGDPICSKR